MKTPPLSRLAAFYDRLAGVYDWTTFFESRAKRAALEALAPVPGERVLNLGVGTGSEQAVIRRALGPAGLAVGVDIAWRMLRIARRKAGGALVQADLYALPFPPRTFDALLCTYVLDLLPAETLPGLLANFHRLLRPGGRAVLLTLTEGVTPLGRSAMALWKAVYRLAPLACGGCRPLQLAPWAAEAGFHVQTDRVIEEWGMPSNLLLLEKPA